jgi:hypothetical protein
MMEFQYLTPEDQLLLDPYGLNRSALKAIPLEGSRFNPPSPWYDVNPTQAFEFLASVRRNLRCDKHRPYFEYMDEMDAKCGPQGGYYGRKQMEALLEPYYVNAHNSHRMHRILIRGRDYLLRRIKQIKADYGGPQVQPVRIIRTNAACPTGLMKGDYLAETLGMKSWRHMFPAVPGQRRMRNSDRLIFQDSVNNVRYMEQELTAVRNWLKHYLPEYFGAWCNPALYVNPMLTRALIRHAQFVETDYVKMDQHFSWDVVAEIILPIYEVLNPDSYLSFAAAVEELFKQSVYLGDRITVGLHNLFSGEGITNDFETEYTVCLALGVALTLHTMDTFSMTAIGDDCTVALESKSKTLAQKFRDLMIEVSNEADMIIHDDEKSRVVVGETRFCRKVYHLGGAKDCNGNLLGLYPLNLMLNSIIQPERLQSNAGIAAVADLQRLDNGFGAPGWHEMVQYCWKHAKHSFAELDPSQVDKDWWSRVYGESWSPESSPAVRFIQKMYEEHHGDSPFFTLK